MSHIFGAIASIEILDGIAAALLAAAASARAKNFGAHITGAIALGCVCGMVGGLTREIFLNGSAGARVALASLPQSALIGALCGVLATRFLPSRKDAVFFWLDAASMGLAGSLGAALGLPGLGVVGALALGLVSGLSPSLARDASLGDTAMIVEKSWYATAVALGCVGAICVAIGGLVIDEVALARIGEYAVIFGSLLTLAIRGWKGREDDNRV